MKKCGLWFLAMMLAPFYAFAVDGVVLINQSSVLAAGGFPYVIANSGAYKLSGNLIVPHANTTAIMITSSNVSVDMNGFSILGPTVCTGTSFAVTACSPTGNGDGISTSLAANSRVNVSNGNVKGMGRFGINPMAVSNVPLKSANTLLAHGEHWYSHWPRQAQRQHRLLQRSAWNTKQRGAASQ